MVESILRRVADVICYLSVVVRNKLYYNSMCRRVRTPYTRNKIKNKKYHTVGTVPKSNRIIVERDTFDTCNTHKHDRCLSL